MRSTRSSSGLLIAVTMLLLVGGPAAAQQDPAPARAMPGMEDCRSMHEMMGRLSAMMSESRAGEPAQMGESMDRMQRVMAEMREPMDRCMAMMSAMPSMGSTAGTQGGMGQGGMMGLGQGQGGMMMGACCPPGMSEGPAGIVIMVIGALAGLSLIAALLALTIFLLRRSRSSAPPATAS